MITLKVEKISPYATLPTKAHPDDLGWDLYSPDNFVLYRGEVRLVPIGIRIELPTGYGALIKDRSSMAAKGIHILGGVIDNGYRGEIIIMFYNVNRLTKGFSAGGKIGQLILIPVVNSIIVEQIVSNETVRGEKGFGSSNTYKDRMYD